MDGQMSMLDNPVGHNSLGSALEFAFADGDLYLNPKGGGLSLTKNMQNKLRGIAEKIYFCYLQCFFIDTLQARKMQQIAEDAAPPEPEFEEIGERESLE